MPDQDPEEIARLVAAHLEKIAPPGRARARRAQPRRPPVSRAHGPPGLRGREARLRQGVRRPTVFIREGGSIPFVRTIADATGKPCLLMGFGQPDENAHAPNEWIDLENFHLGIKSAAHLYDELSNLK